MQNAFKNFENLVIVGVSEWVTNRGKQSAVFDKGVVFETVHNGLDVDAFKITDYEILYEKYNIPKGKNIVLHVTPNFNHSIKGGKYVVEVAKMLPDVQFIIVGFNGDKDILTENIIPIAHTKDKNELAQFYNLADITLLTSQKETFSMIVAESLCCGTPVVGFEAGAPETITIPQYSAFSKQGDVERLSKNIKDFLNKEFDCEEISNEARGKYACQNMVNDYISCYKV
jgi:glycosyltransferase involved in cell wall biosynthesis